jgi:hypothetical protein
MDDPERYQSATGCWGYSVRIHPYVCFPSLSAPSPLNANDYIITYSSDFENKFVCGEIMAYEDLKEHGSEASVKAAGKLRQQGKPYESAFHSCRLSRCPFHTHTFHCPVSVLSTDFLVRQTVMDGDIAYWKSGA